MSYKLIPTLKNLVKKYPSLQKDLSVLEDQLLKQPNLGTSIGHNCFKIRIAIRSKGKGKSGGARIITFVKVIDENIFMIAIYDKSESQNISDKELMNRLRKL